MRPPTSAVPHVQDRCLERSPVRHSNRRCLRVLVRAKNPNSRLGSQAPRVVVHGSTFPLASGRRTSTVAAPDRALPVPHQYPEDRSEGADLLPPARGQILRSMNLTDRRTRLSARPFSSWS